LASSSRSPRLAAALVCVATSLQAQTAGPLVLAGRLLRVSGTDSVPVAGVFVVGHEIGPDRQGAVDSVRSDAAGRFRIVVARPDTAALYVVSSLHHGIGYFSETFAPGDRSAAGAISLPVYDTSSSGPPLALAMRHMVIAAPDDGGGRRVLDILQIHNPGTTTRVGADSLAPTWRVRLPARVADFEPGEGDVPPASLRLDGDLLSVAAPFPPGDKQVVVSYALPLGARAVAVPIDQPTARIDLLIEGGGGTASGAGLLPAEPLLLEGRSYAHFTAERLAAGAQLTVRVATAGFDGRRFVWVAVLAAAVALAAGALVAARRRAAPRSAADSRGREADDPDALAARIAVLDERYEGREADATADERARHCARRAELKRRLEAALARRGAL